LARAVPIARGDPTPTLPAVKYFPSLTERLAAAYSIWTGHRRSLISRCVDAKGRKEMDEARKLRELAAWYREFAERAGAPWIWDARLRTADKLEKEAGLLEERLLKTKEPVSPPKA